MDCVAYKQNIFRLWLTSFSLVGGYQHLRITSPHYYPEHRGDMILWNIDSHLPGCMVSNQKTTVLLLFAVKTSDDQKKKPA